VAKLLGIFFMVYLASGSDWVEGIFVAEEDAGEFKDEEAGVEAGEVWGDWGRLVGLRYDSPDFCSVVGLIFDGRWASSGIFFDFSTLVVGGGCGGGSSDLAGPVLDFCLLRTELRTFMFTQRYFRQK
jgi:hypothetical protein